MSIYHLTVKTGSRIGGQSALAKSDYIEREGRYAKDAEEVEYKESGNMPEWAEDDPRQYWAAADAGERANGRLFREVEFALPRELNAAERVQLATSFAEHLTADERLPYTLAVHRGGGENPHVHLVFSERANDGIERSAEQWFKRYNAQDQEKGGARKSTASKPREWLEDTREDWADHANRALERAGSFGRINEASLETQYFDAVEDGDERRAAELEHREAGQHMGPHNIARAERGEDVDRIADAQDAADRHRLRWIERRLQQLEKEIREVAQRIAERVKTWNRPSRGPEIDWRS